MGYILDTHAFLWFLNGDSSLSAKAIKIIENADSIKYISIASLWEIAIKLNIGRLSLDFPFKEFKKHIIKNGFHILPITFNDILKLNNLKMYHRDPFDRIIISQGIQNNFSIITKDKNFEQYNVKLIW